MVQQLLSLIERHGFIMRGTVMKVTQPGPDELSVVDFPVFTGGLCGFIFVVFAGMFLRTAAIHPLDVKKLLGNVLGALVGGIGAVYLLKRSVVHLDRRIGQATWSRRGILGTQSGQIQLSDIHDVTVEILSENRSNTYRVALVTPTERWPLTPYYSGNKASSEKVKETLRTFLGFASQPAATSLDAQLRSLVASGQTIEAIKLVRTERNLSLKDAKEFVDSLKPRSSA